MHRKILLWRWFNNPNVLSLFINLLLRANSKPGYWNGVKVERGQLITSLKTLSEQTGLSIQETRTGLKRLINSSELNIVTNNRYRLITITKYDSYQPLPESANKANNKLSTSQQQASNKPATTNKNIEDKKENIVSDKSNNKKSTNKIIKPTKVSRGKKSAGDFVDKIVTCFAEVHGDYEILNKGKERQAAGKLLSLYKKKYPDADSEQTLAGLKAYFEKCVKINDNWLRDNMSLPLIVSKFNEIKRKLSNGKVTREKQERELDQLWQDIHSRMDARTGD